MKDIKKEFENSFSGYHKDAPAHLHNESKKLAKQRALNKAVDAKYDKINKEKGLTPGGKRKWHYYNSKIK